MIEYYVILGFVSLILTLVAVVSFTISAFRFLTGEFRKILTSVIIALYSMAIPYTLFILRDTSLVTQNHLLMRREAGKQRCLCLIRASMFSLLQEDQAAARPCRLLPNRASGQLVWIRMSG